ncbi:hypothetical protein CAPN004_09620 [Capnocytophaga cynodegmi]|nr:hypothetical protein CAPN004_09620 [Capnocytophaga cynodegmi]
MPLILIGFALLSFLLLPIYSVQNYDFLPIFLANYFTQANGSVFTIFPWFGYAAFGAFIGVLFSIFKDNKHVYSYAITFSIIFGLILSFGSQPFFYWLYNMKDSQLAFLISENTIFNRLGNVLLVFSVFMLLRDVIMSSTIRTIGQNTLSIYIIHYIILYGSFTGFGLYQYFHHSLNPYVVAIGALLFILVNIWLSFKYNQWKPFAVDKYRIIKDECKSFLVEGYYLTISFLNKLKNKILDFIFVSKRNS